LADIALERKVVIAMKGKKPKKSKVPPKKHNRMYIRVSRDIQEQIQAISSESGIEIWKLLEPMFRRFVDEWDKEKINQYPGRLYDISRQKASN
jgi:hypothetical protein